jgi:hypothetical protein
LDQVLVTGRAGRFVPRRGKIMLVDEICCPGQQYAAREGPRNRKWRRRCHGRGVIRACDDRKKSGIIWRKGCVQTACKA